MKYAISSDGFSLIEVIIAMMILAMVMGSSLYLFKNSTRNIALTRDKTMANWVALNYAVQQKIDKTWPGIGSSKKSVTTMANKEWYINAKAEQTGNKDFRKINIRVFVNKDDEQEIFSMYAYVAK